MPRISEGMQWFKKNFGDKVIKDTNDTPFTIDLLTAIAVQETFEVWGNLFTSQKPSDILEICVGDVIDGPRRKAFPTSKAALLSIQNGQAIFDVARQALLDMGHFNAVYHKIAEANPNKFCHGFGIFQLDLQFCKSNPGYFLEKKWFDFDQCLESALGELGNALKRAGVKSKNKLSDEDAAHVAIAYNAGSFDPKRGLKQGFKDESGKYYGELIFQYIEMAHEIN